MPDLVPTISKELPGATMYGYPTIPQSVQSFMCIVLWTVLHQSCKCRSVKRGVKAAAFAELTDLI